MVQFDVSKEPPLKVSSHILKYPAGAQIADVETQKIKTLANSIDFDRRLFIYTFLKNDMTTEFQ